MTFDDGAEFEPQSVDGRINAPCIAPSARLECSSSALHSVGWDTNQAPPHTVEIGLCPIRAMTSPLSDGYLSSMMSPPTPSSPMANGLGAFSSSFESVYFLNILEHRHSLSLSLNDDALWTVPNAESSDSMATMVSTPNSVAASIEAASIAAEMGTPSVPMAAAGGHWDSVPMHFVPVQEPFNHLATGPTVAMEEDPPILNAPNPEQWAGTRPSREIQSERPPNELLFGPVWNDTVHSAHSMANRLPFLTMAHSHSLSLYGRWGSDGPVCGEQFESGVGLKVNASAPAKGGIYILRELTVEMMSLCDDHFETDCKNEGKAPFGYFKESNILIG